MKPNPPRNMEPAKTIVLTELLTPEQVKACAKLLVNPSLTDPDRTTLLLAFTDGLREELAAQGVRSEYLAMILLSSPDINRARSRAQKGALIEV